MIAGARVFFTVALDVVISGIHEPVRFLIEGKARVCQSNPSDDGSSQEASESIWASFKKVTPFFEDFDLLLKQVNNRECTTTEREAVIVQVSPRSSHQEEIYEVVLLESKCESERRGKSRRLSSGEEMNVFTCHSRRRVCLMMHFSRQLR